LTRLRRLSRSRGGLVTFGVVIGLLVALGITLFGLGTVDHALATSNASAWLFSSTKGEVARVNGETGKVDTRFKVVDAQGHVIVVSQSDRYLLLRDLTTGKVSSLDLATLQISATTQTTAGLGVTLALSGDSAFIVDAVQGVVRQLDPIALTPMGDPLRFPPGVLGGAFDGAGTLWLVVPSEGTVVGIRPAPLHPSPGAAANPQTVRTVAVADPGHDLAMSTLSAGVAVLDSTTTTLTTVVGDKTSTLKVPLSGVGTLPDRSGTDAIPVTVVDDRHVYVISGTAVHDFAVPGSGGTLSPAVPFAGRFYVADNRAGSVYVLDGTGSLVDTITIPGAGGQLELSVRGDHLFINAPNSASARVVDNHGHVKVVDKYASNVVGAEPPPNPPPAPPKAPTVGPPSAPQRVVATAGNATVHLTWGPANPNGSPILRYVVEGDGQLHQVGANQRALDIAGLTNGRMYTFTVYAVNAKGSGPKRAANPVMPTSEVPDPPLSVSARENKDGTVAIAWSAANGLGHKVIRYDITTVSAGSQAPLASATGVAYTVPAGQLTYGTQYAFIVTAINDKGTASKPSPVSNTVVPFTVPGPPRNLQPVPVDAKGTISLAWQPAANNGRPVTSYTVTAGGQTQTVSGATTVTLSGFADNAPVPATVRAVNAAGPGPVANTTATTIGPPTLTAGQASAQGYNAINVPFTTNPHGGATTCGISLNGGAAAGIGCNGGQVGGLWPGNTYNFTVTATNKAGSASFAGSVATPGINGTVICPNNYNGYCNSGIWTYRTATQSGTAVRALPIGRVFKADCWVSGGNVNASPWGAKNSPVWIRFTGQGTEYFPWAWTRLDGGDNYRLLPGC
jgi:Fibronectin type III domain